MGAAASPACGNLGGVNEPRTSTPPPVYDWQTAIGVAVGGTIAAVGLVVLFTYLVDWVGDFWSQVIYFLAVFGGVVALALRSRRKDEEDPGRLTAGGPTITPAGLPGPFVVTQALGVLAIAMLVVAVAVGGERAILWAFSALVLGLVGVVGLIFWLLGLRTRRG
jgi:peptidoglycan/LPS O-acetylase OafA/YrhL